MKDINNRRYIGSKTKLLDFIFSNIEQNKYESFSDVFSGTGIVGVEALKRNFKVVKFNDLLYSNYVIYNAFFLGKKTETTNYLIEKYNNLCELNSNNYLSTYFGGKYFTNENATIINNFREEVEKLYNQTKISDSEYYYLIAVILYATDKFANTTGHFEHYLSNIRSEKKIIFENLNTLNNFSGNIEIYNSDSNKIVDKLSADVVYLDPPYNARQYINFYHVLENIALWQKPTNLKGKSNKFDREHLKSEYSKVNAKNVFLDLINKINAKKIIVSYNNTYNAKSGASNNKITYEEMVKILESKGKLTIKSIGYKSFNSGKTNFSNHQELLFIVDVK